MTESNRGGRRYAIYGLIVVLTLICYLPGVSAPAFLIDDQELASGTWDVWDDPAGIVRIWSGEMHPIAVRYRPGGDTVIWGAHRLWGESPVGFRLLHIFLHLLMVFLAISIFRKFRLPGPEWIGLFVAIHPANVQSIMWIAQERQLIANTLCVAAMWAFVQHHFSQSLRWGGLGLLFLALGVLVKTTVVSVPVIVVLLVLMFRIRPTLRSWCFIGASFVIVVAGGLLDIAVNSIYNEEVGAATPLMRFEKLVLAALQALRNLLVPHPLGLLYDQRVEVGELLCVGVVIVAGLGLWRFRGKAAAIQLFLILSACVAIIAPWAMNMTATGAFTPIQERYYALVLFLIVPFVGYQLAPLLRPGRSRSYAIAGLGLVAGLCFVASANQVRLYRDPQTFFANAARIMPNSVMLHMVWAMSLRDLDRFDEAERVLSDEVRLLDEEGAPEDDFIRKAIRIERLQNALGRGAYAESLAYVVQPDGFSLVPLEAIVGALRLESPDASVRDEREGHRIVARLVHLERVMRPLLPPTWAAWFDLRLRTVRASAHAARGEFPQAVQILKDVLASPILALSGQKRERVRADIQRRLHSYEQQRPYMRPESQLLWRLNTIFADLW
jgi:hypothetical protein